MLIIQLIYLSLNTDNLSLFVIGLGHMLIYTFLNICYTANEIRYIINNRMFDPNYGRDDYQKMINPFKPLSMSKLWRHFYFDLFHIAVYLEYLLWKRREEKYK